MEQELPVFGNIVNSKTVFVADDLLDLFKKTCDLEHSVPIYQQTVINFEDQAFAYVECGLDVILDHFNALVSVNLLRVQTIQ